MTTSVTTILNRVRVLLIDQEGDRWLDDELLEWLNEGQRAVVGIKPDTNTIRETFNCAAGTRQTLPAGATQLLDIPRNADGTLRAVRYVARHTLDSENPYWHSSVASGEIRNYVYDKNDGMTFFVYPPAEADAALEIVYSAIPTDCVINGDITLADDMAAPLVDYVCYRAYMKDGDFALNAQRATTHYQAFIAGVTGRELAEVQDAPQVSTNEPGAAAGGS